MDAGGGGVTLVSAQDDPGLEPGLVSASSSLLLILGLMFSFLGTCLMKNSACQFSQLIQPFSASWSHSTPWFFFLLHSCYHSH